jgi:hypothetical protein
VCKFCTNVLFDFYYRVRAFICIEKLLVAVSLNMSESRGRGRGRGRGYVPPGLVAPGAGANGSAGLPQDPSK